MQTNTNKSQKCMKQFQKGKLFIRRLFCKSILIVSLSLLFLFIFTCIIQANQESRGNSNLPTINQEMSLVQKSINSKESKILANRQVSDTGEFIRVNGRKIKLLRSLQKVAIQTQSNRDTSLINNFESIGRIKAQVVLNNERYDHVITIIETPQNESLNELNKSMNQLKEVPGVMQVKPVYINEESGLELIPNEDFIVKLSEGSIISDLEPINAITGAILVKGLSGTTDQFILTLPGCTSEELIAVCEIYYQTPAIEWAEPDFIAQAVTNTTVPNDTYYNNYQWQLPDINIPEGWDVTTGSEEICIAIIDDGVEITHEDLIDNLFINTDENSGINGYDDDDNGYVDDFSGWNFYHQNNNPNPIDDKDNHGTSVAGVAAAVGNNNKGVAGCAFNCKIMPLKVVKGDYSLYSGFSEAILYASGFCKNGVDRWKGADIINISYTLGGGNCIDDAITKATTEGRDGKGCPIFCSSGNYASVWISQSIEIKSPGNHVIRWEYTKDDSESNGSDTVWIDNIIFPDDSIETFENVSLPSGWSTGSTGGGNAGWYRVQDSIEGNHALTGWGGPGSHSMRAGKITHNQSTYIEVRKYFPEAGKIYFYYWISSELVLNQETEQYKYDVFHIDIDGQPYKVSTSEDKEEVWGDAGVKGVSFPVNYPANHPNTIAVGASTNFGYRADYSCFGHGLDFVAPSGGGSKGITTTDRTGSKGYNDELQYTSGFGGTSSASPLAAGLGALLLSKNPDLTASEVRQIMRDSCNKIGDVIYDANGWNEYYGYGRIDAKKVLGSSGSSILICGADSYENLQDIQGKLFDTGKFATVDFLNVRFETPTINYLQAYDAVLIYCNYPYENSEALGDVMADYVDNGGGVVCMMFEVAAAISPDYLMQGRWAFEPYYAIPRGFFYAGTRATLGTVFYPQHPIMQGVESFDGGSSSYRTNTTEISAGCIRVANWSDNSPLVVTRLIGNARTVSLAFYPPSSDRRDDLWDSSTDGALLMANSLIWASQK